MNGSTKGIPGTHYDQAIVSPKKSVQKAPSRLHFDKSEPNKHKITSSPKVKETEESPKDPCLETMTNMNVQEEDRRIFDTEIVRDEVAVGC